MAEWGYSADERGPVAKRLTPGEIQYLCRQMVMHASKSFPNVVVFDFIVTYKYAREEEDSQNKLLESNILNQELAPRACRLDLAYGAILPGSQTWGEI